MSASLISSMPSNSSDDGAAFGPACLGLGLGVMFELESGLGAKKEGMSDGARVAARGVGVALARFISKYGLVFPGRGGRGGTVGGEGEGRKEDLAVGERGAYWNVRGADDRSIVRMHLCECDLLRRSIAMVG